MRSGAQIEAAKGQGGRGRRRAARHVVEVLAAFDELQAARLARDDGDGALDVVEAVARVVLHERLDQRRLANLESGWGCLLGVKSRRANGGASAQLGWRGDGAWRCDDAAAPGTENRTWGGPWTTTTKGGGSSATFSEMGACSLRCSFSALRVRSRFARAPDEKMNACAICDERETSRAWSDARRRDHLLLQSVSASFRRTFGLDFSVLRPFFFLSASFFLSAGAGGEILVGSRLPGERGCLLPLTCFRSRPLLAVGLGEIFSDGVHVCVHSAAEEARAAPGEKSGTTSPSQTAGGRH